MKPQYHIAILSLDTSQIPGTLIAPELTTARHRPEFATTAT